MLDACHPVTAPDVRIQTADVVLNEYCVIAARTTQPPLVLTPVLLLAVLPLVLPVALAVVLAELTVLPELVVLNPGPELDFEPSDVDVPGDRLVVDVDVRLAGPLPYDDVPLLVLAAASMLASGTAAVIGLDVPLAASPASAAQPATSRARNGMTTAAKAASFTIERRRMGGPFPFGEADARLRTWCLDPDVPYAPCFPCYVCTYAVS